MTKNSDPATDPRIKERPLKKYLRCTLTDDEKVVLAETMAEKQSELEDLEDQKKAVTKDFAGKIELVQAEVRKSSNTYRQGWEMREVDCVEIKNPVNGTMTVQRMDTGEIVSTRRLTQDELQGNLLDDAA